MAPPKQKKTNDERLAYRPDTEDKNNRSSGVVDSRMAERLDALAGGPEFPEDEYKIYEKNGRRYVEDIRTGKMERIYFLDDEWMLSAEERDDKAMRMAKSYNRTIAQRDQRRQERAEQERGEAMARQRRDTGPIALARLDDMKEQKEQLEGGETPEMTRRRLGLEGDENLRVFASMEEPKHLVDDIMLHIDPREGPLEDFYEDTQAGRLARRKKQAGAYLLAQALEDPSGKHANAFEYYAALEGGQADVDFKEVEYARNEIKYGPEVDEILESGLMLSDIVLDETRGEELKMAALWRLVKGATHIGGEGRKGMRKARGELALVYEEYPPGSEVEEMIENVLNKDGRGDKRRNEKLRRWYARGENIVDEFVRNDPDSGEREILLVMEVLVKNGDEAELRRLAKATETSFPELKPQIAQKAQEVYSQNIQKDFENKVDVIKKYVLAEPRPSSPQVKIVIDVLNLISVGRGEHAERAKAQLKRFSGLNPDLLAGNEEYLEETMARIEVRDDAKNKKRRKKKRYANNAGGSATSVGAI